MFESRFSVGATEKSLGCEKSFTRRLSRGPTDMEGHAQKCVEWYSELASKKAEQFYKVSSSSLDDHQFKQQELESFLELSEDCLQIVLKCLYLARTGRSDIPWSVNKLARSVTKSSMGQTTGKIDILHSSHTISDNIVMWETRHSIVDWVCCKTQNLLATLRTRNQPHEETCVSLEAEHLFL